jgi:glutamate-ammonia-ligase adenylyltransferase
LKAGRPERDPVVDAVAMRAEMAQHKPAAGPFDVKLLPGGLVDLEFAVHARQLARRTGFDPDLRRAIDVLAAEGLVPAALREAHDLLTRLLVTLRLVAPDGQEPGEATRSLVARALGLGDWPAVVAAFGRTRQEVGRLWREIGDERG